MRDYSEEEFGENVINWVNVVFGISDFWKFLSLNERFSCKTAFKKGTQVLLQVKDDIIYLIDEYKNTEFS